MYKYLEGTGATACGALLAAQHRNAHGVDGEDDPVQGEGQEAGDISWARVCGKEKRMRSWVRVFANKREQRGLRQILRLRKGVQRGETSQLVSNPIRVWQGPQTHF